MTTRVAEIKSSGSYRTMSKAVMRTQTVSFHRMEKGKEIDYALIHNLRHSPISALMLRIISALKTLEYSLLGYQVSRLEYSLKRGMPAEQYNADIELIIATLIHDTGDDLALEDYSQMPAAIIRRNVRCEVT